MHRLTLTLAALVFAAAGAVALAAPAQAASLTSDQVQSIVMLLQSFGVNSSTVTNVRNVLIGAPIMPTAATSTVAVSTSSTGVACPTFSEDLYRGRSDKHTEDEVSMLQRFLARASSSAYAAGATGYFGAETEAGVKAWQAAHGVPATGFVGPLTRAAIAHACNPSRHDDHVPSAYRAGIYQNQVNLSAQPMSGTAPLTVAFSATGASSTQKYILTYGDGAVSGAFSGTSTVSHTYAKPGEYTATLSPYVACMYSTPRCEIAVMMLAQARVRVTGTTSPATNTLPTIVSLSPATGAVGTQVTIGGNGFTQNNTVLFNNSVAARDVAARPAVYNCLMIPAGATTTSCGSYAQTLTFSVPQGMGPYCPAGEFCPLYMLQVAPGPYAVSVVNENGVSATSAFTVASSSAQE